MNIDFFDMACAEAIKFSNLHSGRMPSAKKISDMVQARFQSNGVEDHEDGSTHLSERTAASWLSQIKLIVDVNSLSKN